MSKPNVYQLNHRYPSALNKRLTIDKQTNSIQESVRGFPWRLQPTDDGYHDERGKNVGQ